VRKILAEKIRHQKIFRDPFLKLKGAIKPKKKKDNMSMEMNASSIGKDASKGKDERPPKECRHPIRGEALTRTEQRVRGPSIGRRRAPEKLCKGLSLLGGTRQEGEEVEACLSKSIRKCTSFSVKDQPTKSKSKNSNSKNIEQKNQEKVGSEPRSTKQFF